MTRVCGIDLGRNGAVAVIEGHEVLLLERIPTHADGTIDCKTLLLTLLHWSPARVAFEDCFRPKVLVNAVGRAEAVCELAEIPYRRVHPSSWKRAVLGAATSDKAVSIRKATELFPNTILVPEGCRKPSHDRAEALLIAYYLATKT